MYVDQLLNTTLTQLQLVLSQLSHEEYGRHLPVLSNASVGQHTRHIIEFFALEELSLIRNTIAKEDKDILVTGTYTNEVPSEYAVRSTYYREMIYNLEHMVHHMAMIKIGIRQSTNVLVPADFGVASSTIQYKKSIL